METQLHDIPEIVMSGSEPGTPKMKGLKDPNLLRQNGQEKGHGRSVSSGSYGINRISTGSTGKKKNKIHRISTQTSKNPDGSESDESDLESNESEHSDSQDSKTSPAGTKARKKGEWEILEGLKDGQICADKPEKYEGYMMKRRKWPLKGWHKRYFVLENGVLTYAKSANDIVKGKFHGTVDVGLSFVTFKRKHRRIDIDAEDLIYHLKVKSPPQLFNDWIQRLRHHRLYRQNEFAFGSKEVPKLSDVSSPVEDFTTPVTSPVSPALPFGEISRGSFKRSTIERSQGKVQAWLLDSQAMDNCAKDLASTQAKIFELGGLLEKLQATNVSFYMGGSSENVVDLHDLATNKKDKGKKDKKEKKGKLTKTDMKSTDRLNVPNGERTLHPSSSNPNLFTPMGNSVERPLSLQDNLVHHTTSGHDMRIQDMKLRDDFITMAKSVHESLRIMTRTLTTERERMKRAIESETVVGSGSAAHVQSLKNTLQEVLKQNEEYKNRLCRINAESNIFTAANALSRGHTPTATPIMSREKITEKGAGAGEHPLVSAAASWESQSAQEFYDANEYIVSSDSSEDSDDNEEISSEISDTENTPALEAEESMVQLTGRRSKLPVPKPEADISLWSLLCKNIGKDLSKISMPVTLNEPLSMLQRLCEELEYTELVDKAAELSDPFERMVYIAAFTVSPYASTYYRAGQKPFNPLLGETYECIREDRGWRFIAEQVSHHPPVSACFCESKNFIFWQDAHIKTKFWGKSMEIQPKGTVNLKLPKHKDHYTWNKATTCVHNLLGGQRWVDHYGEVVIRNLTHGIKCKLTYAKSSYWSDKRHEVYGTITNSEGKVVHHLFGKWNEGIYYGHAPSAKCVWRPGTMPEEFDLYYGFTRFAIELNEIIEDERHLYPRTDTRFRPDQRLLEEGDIAGAEAEKVKVEQLQRERRKQREEEKVTYSPKWFLKADGGEETFGYTGKYWELRKDPGFQNLSLNQLW